MFCYGVGESEVPYLDDGYTSIGTTRVAQVKSNGALSKDHLALRRGS